MPKSADAALGDARTVAIVVHGVGDHSCADIIAQAEEHLATVGAAGLHATRVNFTELNGGAGGVPST